MYRIIILIVFTFATTAFATQKPDDAVRAFLSYQYGSVSPEITDLCLPTPDLWMLHGADQPGKRRIVQNLKVNIGTTGVFMDTIDRDICIVELKEGKVDPQFNLAMIYQMHRQLILQFLYASLLQDKKDISRIVTNAQNVSFGDAPKAGQGDMDVYADILSLIPIVRTSRPDSDAQSKSVTYRLPLGDQVFTVRIIRSEGSWKIDTDHKMTIPLRYFWR